MKKLGKYGKKVSCVVIGMLCAAAIGACGSTQSGSQDEKDVRNDISVYEEGADLEGTLTYGTLFIEPQTQHMIDLFMKEHPGVKIETKVVFDNDVTDEQYNYWVEKIQKLVKTPEFEKEREARGLYPFTVIGKDYQKFMQEEEKKFKALAQEAGLTK